MPRAASIEASGTIEATESDLSPKVQGRLAQLRVRDGDRVRKGQVLAVLERLDPTLGVDQARANVAVAAAQIAAAQAAYDLQRSTYATTLAQANAGVAIAHASLGQAGESLGIETHAAALAVDQAQAQLVAAQSADDRARTNLARARSLVSTGDAARQTLDDAVNAGAQSAAQLKAAHDAVALAQANSRNVQIRQLSVRSSGAGQRQSIAAVGAALAAGANSSLNAARKLEGRRAPSHRPARRWRSRRTSSGNAGRRAVRRLRHLA